MSITYRHSGTWFHVVIKNTGSRARLTGKRGGVQSLVLLKTYLIIDLYTHTLCASVVSFINGGIVIVTVSETKLR